MELKITSICPATEGFEFETCEEFFDSTAQNVGIVRSVHKIVAWAVVEVPQADGSVECCTEPLIAHHEWGVVSESELRWQTGVGTNTLKWRHRILYAGRPLPTGTYRTRALTDADVIAIGSAAERALRRGKAKNIQITNEEIAKRSELPIERIAALRKDPASLAEGVR